MRQFLALELSAPLRQEVGRVQAVLRERCAGWRWVRPGNIHLTIRFLGEVGAERDAASRESWRRASAAVSPFLLRLGGVGRFPPCGRPRVLWVGLDPVDSPAALTGLARRVESAARDLGFAPESRTFRPHLTLARAARGERPDPPPEIDVLALDPMPVEALVLFQSELLPGGARYTAVDAFALEGSRERT